MGARYLPALTIALGAAALAAGSTWLARRGVLDVPLMRARGVNLEARHAGVEPAIWLCAHLDSKSQPVPTLLRAAGIVVESAGFAMMFVIALLVAMGVTVHTYFWLFAAAVTLVGAVPVVLSMVGERSPGALDNASGVAMMIAAASELSHDPRVGVLITDAEEMGLAGARAWARGRQRTTVLNSDGVDDSGEVQVMYTRPRPAALLDAVTRAARGTGVKCNVGPMIPGLLTDSLAFADAGSASVTFSRGTWRSLARVHGRRDDLAHLRGTGIAEVAALVVSTVRELGESR